MNVTVILCTYNRCESLVRVLRSVALARAGILSFLDEWGWDVALN